VQSEPENTPKVTPTVTPLVEITEDEDGAGDTDYAADMAAAQSNWDPWPTTVQDIPQQA